MTVNEKYNLKERTNDFAVNIVKFCSKLPRNPLHSPIVIQLIRSGTSIGANYCEADNAESRLDFRHKVGIVKKEASETIYWLKLIRIAFPQNQKEADELSDEANQIHLIFSSIFNKC